MAAQMCGKNAQVTIRFGDDEPAMEFTGAVMLMQHDDTLDVTNLGGQHQSIQGVARITLDVTPTGPPKPPKRLTIAELMARDVLRRDMNSLAAARALADMLVEDVAMAASGHPTRDELYAHIDELKQQLSDANDRLETMATVALQGATSPDAVEFYDEMESDG